MIIGESGCHFKLLSAVAREGKGLCARHMVALWSEQDVPAWRCAHVCGAEETAVSNNANAVFIRTALSLAEQDHSVEGPHACTS